MIVVLLLVLKAVLVAVVKTLKVLASVEVLEVVMVDVRVGILTSTSLLSR
jgi:hypothetical protein